MCSMKVLLFAILIVHARTESLVVIIQQPANDTYCEGTDAKLSCVIFDNTTTNAADTTVWINADTLVLVAGEMISNTRDDDVVTSVLTIESVSFNNDSGTQYFCSPRRDVDSFVGVISVIVTPPTIGIIAVNEECTYVNVSWMYNSSGCETVNFSVTLTSAFKNETINTTKTSVIFTELLASTSFNITIKGSDTAGNDSNSTSGATQEREEPNVPTMLNANVSIEVTKFVIGVSWQAPLNNSDCAANITKYNVTVEDQYSPATVIVPASMLSVEISEFPDNGTRVVPNRVYNITVSAIDDVGLSNSNDSVTVNTFILQNCTVTSLSNGTIRVSCDSSHQILINLMCTNCSNPTVTSNGSSPFDVTGLDPGVSYNFTIFVYDGDQVVLTNDTENGTVTVIIDPSGTPSNSSSDGNTGAIIGGVVGGIIGVIIVIIIIIFVSYCCICRNTDSTDSDKQGLKSPTYTGGSHTASVQPSSVPHQTAASGEEYAVTAKVNTTTKSSHHPTEEYAMVDKNKKHAAATQGITYADLQPMASSGDRPIGNQGPTATYAQVA